MKLYYDMFIPYMPDQEMDSEGKLTASKQKEAGRNAMIELSNFQRTGMVMSLYNAVFNVCIYKDVDLVDTILGLPEDLEIPNVSINDAVDMCAKMLFKSVNPKNEFDLNLFVGILLTTAHSAIESIQAEQEKAAAESAKEPEDKSQISLAEVMDKQDEKV